MLTIKGYYKICDKPLTKGYWKVGFMAERDDEYEIALNNTMDGTRRYFILNRNPELSSIGKTAYFFKENNKKLNACITADYISNMGNFLEAMNTILQFRA